MTVAKLIEIRDAALAANATKSHSMYDLGHEFVTELVTACAPKDRGGGLLERHAMLEELWAAMKEERSRIDWQDRRLVAACAALRASDATPGKGET